MSLFDMKCLITIVVDTLNMFIENLHKSVDYTTQITNAFFKFSCVQPLMVQHKTTAVEYFTTLRAIKVNKYMKVKKTHDFLRNNILNLLLGL